MSVRIINADVFDGLRQLADESVHCVVTSPPYFGLRDYGVAGQIGLEPTPDAYVSKLVEVFREVRRVLRKDGTCWLNLGDSYSATTKGSSGVGKNATNKGTLLADRSWAIPPGLKPKDLIGIPWRVAFALQADGWWLRQDIIWSKPNPMPESVTDRCTKAHEYIFLLTKDARYFYDAEAIAEGSACAGEFRKFNTAKKASRVVNGGFGSGNEHPDALPVAIAETRNRRSVWEVTTQPFPEAHFATFPPALIEPCIKAGCPQHICPKCGAPWQVILERESNGGWSAKYAAESNDWQPNGGGIRGKRCSGADNPAKILSRELKPSCQCFPPLEDAPSCFTPKPEGGTVLDPFGGSGTTGLVADRLKRNAILIELNPEYASMAECRVKADCPMFAEVNA